MRVIGTAGHVDHGKSTLVEALTGIHPDRLKEEREREMTIDLGFAWLTLPDGEEVGIIDVPGHRDFIENMLAGVGGIDAALFVVAADEGVMPQTREHLAILDILQIQSGIVALTKVDLVDEEWLDLVEDELCANLRNTFLEGASIVRVSARTGQGIPELLDHLAACLAERPPRPDLGSPRLSIDRVFSIAGFGTVVTGTLVDGHFKVGDEVEIAPIGLRGRIRGLQSHKRKEEIALPGSRTAINITGIATDQINRGDVVTHPGKYCLTQRLDVSFRLLPDVSQAIKHNMQVKLFIGSCEILARIRLLGKDELIPGEEGWLQLEPVSPILANRGDHYILRRPSPGETLGGGVIVDPHPNYRYKRFSKETIQRLESLAHGNPSDIMIQTMITVGVMTIKQAIAASNLSQEIATNAILDLIKNGQLLILDSISGSNSPSESQTIIPTTLDGDELIIYPGYWGQLQTKATQEVTNFHRKFPLRPGIPREELKSRIKMVTKDSPRIFNSAISRLVEQDLLHEKGHLLYLPDFQINFTSDQNLKIESLMRDFQAAPFSPPSIKECIARIGEDVFSALVELGQLVTVSSEVVFRKQDYDQMLSELIKLFSQNEMLSAANVRDHFQASRKYSLAFLEYLDANGITIRVGDVRRLKRGIGNQ